MIKLLFFYIVIINLIGLCVMYIDKEKAKHGQYRIPEITLWRVAFLGGAIGTTIGMKVFRHKTRHASFKLGFPTIAVIETILFIYVMIHKI
jgi:uncharacterized membrane protein YsdA (DUF1294 family)